MTRADTQQTANAQQADRVCVGAVAGARGVRGELRIKPFTANPADVAAYGPVETEDGCQRFVLSHVSVQGDKVFARADAVTSREAAEALKGTRLYVARAALPETEEEEYYHADLIGLKATALDGVKIGTVVAVENYGAGDFIEISLQKGAPLLLPFTRDAVPQVNIKEGFVTIDPPQEIDGEGRTKGAKK